MDQGSSGLRVKGPGLRVGAQGLGSNARVESGFRQQMCLLPSVKNTNFV